MPFSQSLGIKNTLVFVFNWKIFPSNQDSVVANNVKPTANKNYAYAFGEREGRHFISSGGVHSKGETIMG